MNGTCTYCGGPRKPRQGANGWCSACTHRWYRAGKPVTGPPPRRQQKASTGRSRKPAVIYRTCDSCGREKEHNRQQWCPACRKRWNRAGRPVAGPPPRRTGREGEYLELTREQYYTQENAAARMEISLRTAQRHEARLRAEGIRPITYESGRLGILATRPAFSAQHKMVVT